MTTTAKHIKSYKRTGDEAGAITVDVVDVNGIQLEMITHGYGGVIKQSGCEGVVYTRGDKVYRGGSFSAETEIPELPGHWYAEAARLACARSLRGKAVTVTDERAESSYGQPVVLVDGEISDLHQYLAPKK